MAAIPGGGGFNLGTAYGAVIIDVSGVGSAMQRASTLIGNGVQSIGDRISGIGDSFSRLGSSLSVISAPLLAVGGVGLKSAADFDTLMKQIEVFGGVAPDQLSKVSDFALKMGADTKFSASDAASAMLDLLKSGQSLEVAMSTLPEVLNLAAAGELGLAESAGIVSSGLAIFQLEATDSARVSNALARAANASRADVRGLGQAMSNVGPVAAQYGLTIEDTAAVMGVFAQNGILGGEAGTALKSVLLNMHRPTTDVKEALSALGLSLYDAQGNTRDFNAILKDLDGALDKLPVEQQNELMQTLGGSFGVVGLSALRAAGGLDQMKSAMAAAPEAASVAASFMNTFKGRVESLKGSFETLMITALTPFMNNFMTPMVEKITKVVNAITDWTKANPELTEKIVKVLAVVAALGPALMGAGQAFSLVGTGMKLFFGEAGKSQGLLGFLLSPLGLITIALTGLFLAFQTNFLGIRDLLGPFIDNFMANIDEIWGSISNFGKNLENGGIGLAVAAVADSILEALGLASNSDEMSGLAQGIGDVFAGIVDFVTNGVIPAIGEFIRIVGGIWEAISPTLTMLGNWFINEALPAIVDVIVNHVVPAVQSFVQFLSDLWVIVGPHLQNLANWFINDVLPKVLAFIDGTVIPGIGKLVDFLKGIWDTVSPFLLDLADWFLNTALPDIVAFVETTVVPGVQAFVDILEGIWLTVEPALGDLHKWFTETALPAIGTAIDNVKKNFIDPIINTLKTIWTTISPALNDVFNWFRDSFAVIGERYIKPVVDFIQSIIDGVGRALDELRRLGGGAGNSAEIIQGGLPPNMQVGAGLLRDMGGPGVAGMAYTIGASQLRNEVYIPGADGQFVSGFVDLMKSVASTVGGAGGKGDVYNIAVQANDYAGGQEAGRGVMDEIMTYKRARGLA